MGHKNSRYLRLCKGGKCEKNVKFEKGNVEFGMWKVE